LSFYSTEKGKKSKTGPNPKKLALRRKRETGGALKGGKENELHLP